MIRRYDACDIRKLAAYYGVHGAVHLPGFLGQEELARLPGVGRSLAHKLVEARQSQGRFTSWAQVDAVSGVGAAKLETLQAATELREAP